MSDELTELSQDELRVEVMRLRAQLADAQETASRAAAAEIAAREALARVVTEATAPSDPDAERWDHDIYKPWHWVQQALSAPSPSAALLAARDEATTRAALGECARSVDMLGSMSSHPNTVAGIAAAIRGWAKTDVAAWLARRDAPRPAPAPTLAPTACSNGNHVTVGSAAQCLCGKLKWSRPADEEPPPRGAFYDLPTLLAAEREQAVAPAATREVVTHDSCGECRNGAVFVGAVYVGPCGQCGGTGRKRGAIPVAPAAGEAKRCETCDGALVPGSVVTRGRTLCPDCAPEKGGAAE